MTRDRLRPEERIVLERAAVIGHELYRGLLVELTPVVKAPDAAVAGGVS